MENNTFIAIQSGGFFGEACVRAGYMTADDCAVIDYKSFMLFMNEGKVSKPVFVSPKYSVCIDAARALNESARAIELEHELAEWVNNRA